MLKQKNVLMVLPVALMSAALALQAAEPSAPSNEPLSVVERQELSETDRASLQAALDAHVKANPVGCFYVKPDLGYFLSWPIIARSWITDLLFRMGYDIQGSYKGKFVDGSELNSVIFCRREIRKEIQ